MSSADNTHPPRAACFDTQPSPLTLIESHLRPWVATGCKPAASFVHETDLYAVGPEELSRSFAPVVALNGERAWYFFTRLRLKGPHGKRFVRAVDTGVGCWRSEAGKTPVVDVLAGSRQVGRRLFFSFARVERGARVRTGWLMAELRLGSEDEKGQDIRALCKVYRSPRHPGEPSERNGEAEDDDDDDGSSATTTTDPALHGNTDGEISGAPAPGRDEKAANDEGSAKMSVEAPARERGAANDKGSAKMSVEAPALERGAANDEGSAVMSVEAPARERGAADDEGSAEISVEASARERGAADDDGKRKAADDDEGSGASRKRTADGNRTGLQCPQCGYHLSAAEAGVDPPKFESETGVAQGEETGDSPVRDGTFYTFL